jgi:transcriptional regulator with XRE-family HTH domain
MPVKPLREHRREQLLTIDALAELAGVSTKTIVETELGRSIPKLRTIAKVSEALGVRPLEVEEFAAAIRGNDADEPKKAAA